MANISLHLWNPACHILTFPMSQQCLLSLINSKQTMQPAELISGAFPVSLLCAEPKAACPLVFLLCRMALWLEGKKKGPSRYDSCHHGIPKGLGFGYCGFLWKRGGAAKLVFEYLAHLIIWQSPFPKDAGLQSFKKNKIRRNLQDKSDIFILKCIIFY